VKGWYKVTGVSAVSSCLKMDSCKVPTQKGPITAHKESLVVCPLIECAKGLRAGR
jgi:hypothetical protein